MSGRTAELDARLMGDDLAAKSKELRDQGAALRRGFVSDARQCAQLRRQAAEACRDARAVRAAVAAVAEQIRTRAR